jgi:hypothetical protein
MLFAAVAGALLLALFGSARILRLRRGARRRRQGQARPVDPRWSVVLGPGDDRVA